MDKGDILKLGKRAEGKRRKAEEDFDKISGENGKIRPFSNTFSKREGKCVGII